MDIPDDIVKELVYELRHNIMYATSGAFPDDQECMFCLADNFPRGGLIYHQQDCFGVRLLSILEQKKEVDSGGETK
jgi:hypothetical protein